MHPFLFIVLAILTPFVLVAVLFVPTYAGIYAASYTVYAKGTADPLSDKYSDVFYIIDVYCKLFEYWLGHISQVSFLHYTLPIVALPLAGVILSFWLTRKIARKMMDVFHLGVAH